ncbi:thiamine pyrophosphate-binding protein [Sphingopyxis flava]|uniref:Acetolactate synthase-1/2/3 large subunit n=1 Tax=Sphingopyxis flava TaxID=1507287 RepID=A0A1T5DX67_9SPHN|nr:thiamine pyrophosphate-dependent enzyme [Sphingopyxis flava]SKB76176.1 acetolactate synthase-1/2/3 large subunit [Sphingopyxis flava]
MTGGRRNFLKTMSAGGLAAVAASGKARAAASGGGTSKVASSVPPIPAAALETAPLEPSESVQTAPSDAALSASARAQPLYGSDYMADCLQHLGLTVIPQVPGSTFTGLHESIVNRGMLREKPLDLLTVTHEEIGVAFAHGYAKVAGDATATIVHSTVGLQHASMALYNAWCDRAPVVCLTGSLTDPESRKNWVDWMHAVSDGPALTRDFTKFDETPRSLPHFTESLVRGYQMAMTPPQGPVVLAIDLNLQERRIAKDEALPSLRKPRISAPQGDSGGVAEAAKMLAQAENPVLIADRTARTAEGFGALIELAETLQAPVIDMGGRLNFPWLHPLNQSFNRGAVLREADVILAMEVQDLSNAVRPAPNARLISLSSYDYYLKSNYQSFQAMPKVDLAIAGDAEATLPALLAALRAAIPRRSRSAIADRGARWAEDRKGQMARARREAALGWSIKPITTGRVWAEVHDQVKDMDWAIVGGCHFEGKWPQQLWDARQHHQYIGDSGGYGLGYLPGAAVGAAYAHRSEGRLPIVFGGDGDLLMAPGALFTAAYHTIPLLYLVHNNGGYHQEIMKVQEQANARARGIARTHVGNVLPGADYAKLGASMGVASQRVVEPGDLRAAIARALEVVASGEPALIDIVSQGR